MSWKITDKLTPGYLLSLKLSYIPFWIDHFSIYWLLLSLWPDNLITSYTMPITDSFTKKTLRSVLLYSPQITLNLYNLMVRPFNDNNSITLPINRISGIFKHLKWSLAHLVLLSSFPSTEVALIYTLPLCEWTILLKANNLYIYIYVCMLTMDKPLTF